MTDIHHLGGVDWLFWHSIAGMLIRMFALYSLVIFASYFLIPVWVGCESHRKRESLKGVVCLFFLAVIFVDSVYHGILVLALLGFSY